MLRDRLRAWFVTVHGGVMRDVLSGKERIFPLEDLRRYPCRTLSKCHFAALNFVRVAFKNLQRARGSSSPAVARWLRAITQQHVLEEILSPCEQLPDAKSFRLEEMQRIPLFERSLRHVATKLGPSNMILLKQSLRQMQLNASPISAIVIGRNTGRTVCLKFRETSNDIFLVLDFASASSERSPGYHTPLAVAISTSLEQTAARLSEILLMDNHVVTRDRQWPAQRFPSCTIFMFVPGEGLVLSPEAESSAIRESVALLKITEEERRRHTGRVDGESLGEGSGTRVAELCPETTSLPYEQTKRHCRIFLPDEELVFPASTSPSPLSYEASAGDEGASIECVICFESIPEKERIRLSPCAHEFCRDCLAGHVCSKIEERKFPVFCPLCMTEQNNANPSVVPGEIFQRLGVSEAQFTAWSELEMEHRCVRIHCRSCNRFTFVDKEDFESREKLSCPFLGCGHTWCKNCQQSLSSDGPKHSCDGSEELDYLVRQMGWKYCTKCRTPVQKSGGCNHMTCATPGCNAHFCYKCGRHITRTSIPLLVRTAVNAHFKQCTL